jgi:tetratricopeptide (TPR) repeat protein
MRALDRPDMTAAANLLGRAEALLEPEDPHRVAILPMLAFALFENGRLEEARAKNAEAGRRADELDDPVAAAHVKVARWELSAAGAEWREPARRDAHEAVRVFEQAGDERGLARAWNLIAQVAWEEGRAGAQLEAVERALEHARRGSAGASEHDALLTITAALVRGPTPVEEGIARAERTIREYSGNREVDAIMCHGLAHLRARIGDFDGAREALDRYRSYYRDTGQTLSLLRSAEAVFDVEVLAGETERACEVVEDAWERLTDLGDRWAYLAAFLSQGRYAVGRYTEAQDAASVAVESADAVERALGLGVIAKVEARSANTDRAEAAIREAIDRVDRTDFLFDRGTVHADRGETLRLLGRDEEKASLAFDEAIRLLDEKGDRISAARIRALRDDR